MNKINSYKDLIAPNSLPVPHRKKAHHDYVNVAKSDWLKKYLNNFFTNQAMRKIWFDVEEIDKDPYFHMLIYFSIYKSVIFCALADSRTEKNIKTDLKKIRKNICELKKLLETNKSVLFGLESDSYLANLVQELGATHFKTDSQLDEFRSLDTILNDLLATIDKTEVPQNSWSKLKNRLNPFTRRKPWITRSRKSLTAKRSQGETTVPILKKRLYV